MPAEKVTPDEAACLLAGQRLAEDAWNRWMENEVNSVISAAAIVWLVEQVLDRFAGLRPAMRVGLQAAIDAESAP